MPYDITFTQNLKYGTKEPIYKTETDSHQSTENRLVIATGEGEGGTGCLGLVDTNYYIQNGYPTAEHRELQPISWNKP